jgi:hypothetical protein
MNLAKGAMLVIRKLLARLRHNKTDADNQDMPPFSRKFSGRLTVDEKNLRQRFERCDDIKYRHIKVPALGYRHTLVVYVEGLVKQDVLNRDIVGALLVMPEGGSKQNLADLVSVGQTTLESRLEDVENNVLSGKILIIADGSREALLIDATDWPMRAIEEPVQERTIRGPRDGFTEVAKINLGLIRRRLPDPSLKVEMIKVGRRSKTDVAILYIDDVADNDVVQGIRERTKSIDIDGLMDSGALTELISERTISPFPLLLNTERPDKIVGGLLQGKVAIITDGSPFATLAPTVFADFYQSPDDYYSHPLFATLARLLRLFGLFFASTATAVYTAVVSFHYDMLPQDIIIFIAETREGVPFTPFVEAILLELAVELIREASLRLPGPIAPSIGIVGALVLGQAAVDARLVSPVLLIIVAASLLANFTLPNFEAAQTIRYLRFAMLFAAGFLSGYAIIIVWLVVAAHLCNLQSFGVPYLWPLAPLNVTELGDNIYRRPWRWMRARPRMTAGKNVTRQKGVESK